MFSYLKWEKNLLQEIVGEQVEFSKILIKMKNCIIFCIQRFAFKMLQECGSWASRYVVQCKYILWHQKQEICWKICKIKDFWPCYRSLLFLMSSGTRFVWIVWIVWKNSKILHAWKNISKKEFQIWDFKLFIF